MYCLNVGLAFGNSNYIVKVAGCKDIGVHRILND